MNPRPLLLAPFVFFVTPLLPAQPNANSQPGVPVTRPSTDKVLYTPPAGENQQVYGQRTSPLIAPDAARATAEKFRAAYGQANAPRIVIYVNRAVGTTDPQLKLTGRTEKTSETSGSAKDAAPKSSTVSTESTYTASDAPAPSLADLQTAREIERLFGRCFRSAGARLADPKAATSLLADEPAVRLAGENSAKEREALNQIADLAIEVLISSRQLTTNKISGEETYTVPDIQVTAIRLSDAAIIGQASTSDVLGDGDHAARLVRQFAVADITEATAFALMADMTANVK